MQPTYTVLKQDYTWCLDKQRTRYLNRTTLGVPINRVSMDNF